MVELEITALNICNINNFKDDLRKIRTNTCVSYIYDSHVFSVVMYKEYYSGKKEYYEYNENGLITHTRTVYSKYSCEGLRGHIYTDTWYDYTDDGEEFIVKEEKKTVNDIYINEYDASGNNIRSKLIVINDDDNTPFESFMEYDDHGREIHNTIFSPDKDGNLDQEDWYQYYDSGEVYYNKHYCKGSLVEMWYDKNGNVIRQERLN